MKSRNSLTVVCISAIVITLLFYKQGIGLNLVIFDILFILGLNFLGHLDRRKAMVIITGTGVLVTAIFSVVHYSAYTYFIHFVSLTLFVGVLNYQSVRSMASVALIAFTSFFLAQVAFWKKVFTFRVKGKNVGSVLWKARIFIAPVIIIGLFLGIYSFSSEAFGGLMGSISDVLEGVLDFLFKDFNFLLIFTLIISLIISSFLWMRVSRKSLEENDAKASLNLARNRPRVHYTFGFMALKNEYKAGVFLLVALNLIILVLNLLDIYWVWFNFEWTGQTLRSYVHEGTYFLIFSILVSIVLVLYFFRGNINFYKENRFLKILSYVWIAQNGVLAISVAIRNFRYMEHYALAYKRIGVVVFLALTLYGLFTVARKIELRKSSFYLFKVNSFALYTILVMTALVNWDTVIAKYNFANADKSYVHLEYLASLSDKALPELTFTTKQLAQIEVQQRRLFEPANDELSYKEYEEKIDTRSKQFKEKWERKGLLAWNWAEYTAYRQLFGND